jgi:Domain of unknown function (DUF4347)
MPVDLNVVSEGSDPPRMWLTSVRGILPPHTRIDAPNVPDMVDRLLRAVRFQRNSIRFLRIYSHGMPGLAFIGTGNSIPQADYHRFGVGEDKDLFNRADLARLTGMFTSDGAVTFYGCQVARGTLGWTFLERLGQLWEASILGSEDTQRPSMAGDLPVSSALTGPLRRVRPGLRESEFRTYRFRGGQTLTEHGPAAPETFITNPFTVP